MDFNKLDNGQMKVAVTIDQICMDSFVISRARFVNWRIRKRIHFETIISNEHNVLWLLDTHKTEIILYNLLSNAFKFTPDGGRISVECSASQENLKIIIRDSGAGLKPPDWLQSLIAITRSNLIITPEKVLVIGLAHAKELCELMDGTITVDSILKVGSSFTVMIPLVTTEVAVQNRKYVLIGSSTAETVDQHPEFFEHQHDGRACYLRQRGSFPIQQYC